MAVISRIRKRAGLLIGLIGFSLLAFILGDLLTSNKSFLRGNDNTVAVIGGHKVNVQDYEEKIKENIDNYKLNQNKETVDEQMTNQLRDQTWGQLLNEEIMGKQYEKTGIVVSSEELFDMVQGKNVHPQIKQAFTDPKTGQFSSAKVVEFLKNMDNDATGKSRAQWIVFENAIKQERISQKYNDLIKQGMYVTTEEAKRDYIDKSKTASVKYVELNYNSIPDSSVQVSDADLKTYYNEHSEKYKQEASRKVEYVVFDVAPSADDRKASQDYINRLVEPFKASTDDSLFAISNSDTKPDFNFHKKGTLSPYIDTVMFHAPIGTVVGPYEENGSINISKLIATKQIPDSIKVSHALVSFKGATRAAENITRTHDEAKKMADSLLTIAKKDEKSFIDIAKNHSDDVTSAAKDGDLGWLNAQSQMDPQFLAGAFATGKGNVTVVESQFGFHIIRVFDEGPSSLQAKVYTVNRKIEPSGKTYQAIFSRANEFAGKNNNGDLFTKAVKEQGLNARQLEKLIESERNVPVLDNAREMVRWAFKANKDEVSKAFEFGDKFAIAHVIQVHEKGIATLDEVKDQVTLEVRKEKKAQTFIDKFNSQLNGATNIDALGTKMNLPVKSAETVSFASPYLPGLGMEQDLVGTIFSMNKGTLSKPIKGEQGVFVVMVNDFKEPPPAKDYNANKKQLLTQGQQRTQYEVFNALKEKADVQDNRGKFY